MDTPGAYGSPILVPLDGSLLAEQAIPYVQTLARSAEVAILLQVLPEPQPVRGLLGEIAVPADEVLRLAREAAQHELQRAADRLTTEVPDCKVETLVEVGDAAERILAVAKERAAGLIVMASQGRGAVGRWTFGSVADRVARTSAVPVMIVRPRDAAAELGPRPIRRLIVPLDGSELAARALPAAAGLARRDDLPVHVVSVVDIARTFVPLLDYGASFSPQLYEQLLADARAEAQRVVECAGARLLRAGLSATWEVRDGVAAYGIMDVCCDGDVIVLTSHGRGGVTRWLLGSVAEKLVREGPVPVILLRSAGPAVEPELEPSGHVDTVAGERGAGT